jgi:hypothetical protein
VNDGVKVGMILMISYSFVQHRLTRYDIECYIMSGRKWNLLLAVAVLLVRRTICFYDVARGRFYQFIATTQSIIGKEKIEKLI